MMPLFAGMLMVDQAVVLQIVAVLGGVALGAMHRAGWLRQKRRPWSEVMADLMVSVLVFGANSVMALVLVEVLEVTIVMAMGVGVIVGSTGVRAVPQIRDAVLKRCLGNTIALIEPKNGDIDERLRELDEKGSQHDR